MLELMTWIYFGVLIVVFYWLITSVFGDNK